MPRNHRFHVAIEVWLDDKARVGLANKINRPFKQMIRSYEAIVDRYCYTWNQHADRP